MRETKQVAFRLPQILLDALDEHIAWVHEHRPHQRYTRTDAVRDLLAIGLRVTENGQNGAQGLAPRAKSLESDGSAQS